MLLPGWWYAITARSLLDLLTNTPDLVELAPQIRCRTLFLRGDEEPPHLYPAEEFRARAGGQVEVRVLDDCDHFYNGAEGTTGELVGDWLASVVAGS